MHSYIPTSIYNLNTFMGRYTHFFQSLPKVCLYPTPTRLIKESLSARPVKIALDDLPVGHQLVTQIYSFNSSAATMWTKMK